MKPPTNPRAYEARNAITVYSRGVIRNAANYFDYHLTWSSAQSGVCVVTSQWRRNAAGEIEAWYTREQLAEVVKVMDVIRTINNER